MLLRLRDALRRRSTLSSWCSGGVDKDKNQNSRPTSQIMENSAAQAVFETPELLEIILAHLDQDQLMRMQRVCRRWKDIIHGSTPLRRMLYLAPALKSDDRISVDNLWLKRKFPDFGIYLLQGNPKWRPKFVRALSSKDFDVNRLGNSFFEPNASWRDMLLTQTPIKEMVVFSYIHEKPTEGRKRSSFNLFGSREGGTGEDRNPTAPTMEEMIKASVSIKNKNGITMGMVVDAGIEARRRGSLAAKRQISDRKDSGYASLRDSQVDDIEISVIEISDN